MARMLRSYENENSTVVKSKLQLQSIVLWYEIVCSGRWEFFRLVFRRHARQQTK
jgi:hypothetical protein